MSLEVRTLAATYYDGYHIEPHTHPWGQLIFAAKGVMRVNVADRLWIVPPERAIWAPPLTRHEIWAQGTFSMRTLYLAPRLTGLLTEECHAIEVSPLLRELILHIVRLAMLDGTEASHRRLIGVLIDQLNATEILPLSLKMPRDKRARLIAERLQKNPSDDTELPELAKIAGASVRTLQRLYRTETGLRFVEWRQRLRLLHAIALLSTCASVTQAGFEAGYASTSAFIAAFRKQLGETPMRFRSARSDDTPVTLD